MFLLAPFTAEICQYWNRQYRLDCCLGKCWTTRRRQRQRQGLQSLQGRFASWRSGRRPRAFSRLGIGHTDSRSREVLMGPCLADFTTLLLVGSAFGTQCPPLAHHSPTRPMSPSRRRHIGTASPYQHFLWMWFPTMLQSSNEPPLCRFS